MPEPRKRRIIDENEEEDVHSSSRAATPRTRKGSSGKGVKRSKLHDPAEDDQEEIMNDDDDEEEEVSFRREEPEGWGNDDELDGPSAADEKSWKEEAEKEYKRSKARRGKQGMIAEMGVIEQIEMFDFMCHRHLKVPFGPKINFIIGHNGSGKSAILTAIMVCLGGKANATNRAQSLKALIREGANQTEVRLQLRNRGNDAYKTNIYGESIIIERRISRDGSSGYKIKSSKGKTISTKRDELSAICDHMNIQVDNPMNCLSQDTARRFLQSSTPEEKYKFFSRGTQLHQLSVDYETVRECIDSMQTTLASKTELLPELYELAKAAQARFKDSQQAAQLELKVEGLKQQIAWAQIEELENGVRDTEDSLDELKSKIPAIEKKRELESKAVRDIDEKIQKLEQVAAEHSGSNAPSRERKRRLEQEYRGKRSELKEIQDEENTVNEEIKSLRSQIRSFDQKIEQELKKLERSTGSRRAEIEAQIQGLKEEIERSKRQVAGDRESLATLEQQVDTQKELADQKLRDTNQYKIEYSNAKDSIKQLTDQKQNSLRAFGPSIPDVLNAIQEVTKRRGWTGETPVGPLGRHVKIRDERWAPVVESALGGVLNAFAVTTDADRSTLFGIFKRFRCFADILMTKKILFDYKNKEPASHFLTINRVLDFDNEWVRRLLIDRSNIESTILMEVRAEADVVTRSGPNKSFPENVTQCFTIDLMRVGDRSGGFSSMMMHKYSGPPRVTKNVGLELERQEGIARENEDKLKYGLQEYRALGAEVERLERERIRSKKAIGNIEKDIKMKIRATEDLQDSIQEDDSTNLQAYEESKQQTLEQIETMKKQYEPVAVQKSSIMESMEPIKEQIAEIEATLRDQESEALKIRNDLDKLNMEKQDRLPKIRYWERKHEDGSLKVRETEKELRLKTQHLEESTVKATEYCARVEVSGTTVQLEREIKKMQERLREQELQRGCSLEEIALDMTRKQDEYKNAKLAIHQLGLFVTNMKATLHQRLSRWREFRAQIIIRSKISFSLQLSHRGYSGELDFECPKKQLNIRVETEDQRSNKTGVARDKDPKSLSGGEKSFSTICLLLSLWESMSSTIRCLDEFDVFMDAVNRRISMKMLIEAARESDGIQYILITPQDASSVSPGPDVRVHRLHDPERNQQTLAL
ncbi:Structural maintenance of chromosomes protein 6 [Entomortierella beljakovae]|nr:Structural maintenance of chromosomes protein 6 [Entomortierella beljakovae]